MRTLLRYLHDTLSNAGYRSIRWYTKLDGLTYVNDVNMKITERSSANEAVTPAVVGSDHLEQGYDGYLLRKGSAYLCAYYPRE